MSRFNADDDALIPVKVVFAFPPDHMSGKHIVEVETELPISGDANHFFVNADKLLPAPREGEYRLTLRELGDLADWYANALALCRINPSSYKERFGDASTSDMVRLWLKNRGKEVKP